MLSESKREEAKKLGATNFLNISDNESVEAAASSFNLILATSFSHSTDWAMHLKLLKNHGTLVLLSVPEKPIGIPVSNLMRHLKIEGSLLGSRQDIKDMLDFAVKHNVRPWIQKIPMKDCNEGVNIVKSGKARFRVILYN